MKYVLLFLVLFVPFVSALSVDFVVSDHLGSPVIVGGNTVDYEPFGVQIGDVRHGYNAKELDITGLNYYGARFYDSVVGRFTNADALIGEITDPQSLNRYIYVKNNPMKFIDASGNLYEEYSTKTSNRFSKLKKTALADIVADPNTKYIVGDFNDYYSGLDSKIVKKVKSFIESAGIKGFAFTGKMLKNQFPDSFQDVDQKAIYLFAKADSSISDGALLRNAYHESRHGKHFVELGVDSSQNPHTRFPVIEGLSQKRTNKVNQFMEEIITDGEVIKYLRSIDAPIEQIRAEQEYMNYNYRNYQKNLYGDTDNAPYGELDMVPNDNYKQLNEIVEPVYHDYSKMWEE